MRSALGGQMSVGPVTSVKKQRSSVERIIVQGGIVVLLVVLAIELRAQKGLSGTLEALRALTDDGEKESSMSEVEQVISLFPSTRLVAENGIETTVEYSWFSIFKNGQYNLNIVSSKKPQPKVAPGTVTKDDSPEQMLRYYTGTQDPMAVKELDPEDIVPRPEGGFSFGSSPSDSGPRDRVPPGGESEPDSVADKATPATESPATETPATETPATETPATETPATETPAEDAPVPGADSKSEKTSDSP